MSDNFADSYFAEHNARPSSASNQPQSLMNKRRKDKRGLVTPRVIARPRFDLGRDVEEEEVVDDINVTFADKPKVAVAPVDPEILRYHVSKYVETNRDLYFIKLVAVNLAIAAFKLDGRYFSKPI